MRILQVIHGYPPAYQAGSEVYTETLCNALIARGHDVAVFTRTENPYSADYALSFTHSETGVQLFRVNMAREKDGFTHPALDWLFAQLIADWKPDLVHIGHLNHLSTGLVKVAKAAKLPVIFTLHDFWLLCPRGQFLQSNFGQPNFYQLCESQADARCARQCYAAYFTEPDSQTCLTAWTEWIGRRMQATDAVLELTDWFISPSTHLAERFCSERPHLAAKMRILRYGFPLHNLRPSQRRLAEDGYTFGYIGTHIPAKGVNLLIEAFAHIDRPARLLIWGRDNNPSTRALRELAAGLPIEFRGEYRNHNIAATVFDCIDSLVVPSIWVENSPLVIQEAQQCRVPVITADVGGMAELVHHHVNGLLFRHRDVQSLRTQLQWAVDHPTELRELGQRGFIHSITGDVVSIDAHVDELEQIYQLVVDPISTSRP